MIALRAHEPLAALVVGGSCCLPKIAYSACGRRAGGGLQGNAEDNTELAGIRGLAPYRLQGVPICDHRRDASVGLRSVGHLELAEDRRDVFFHR